MSSELDKVINELKLLSGGESFNVGLPDDALITSYEKDIGFTFPDGYKKALKEVSNVFYGTVELLSVTKDRNYYGELAQALRDARDQGLPENWLPICEDNGSYYCLVPDGQVRYWTTDGYSDEKWPDLASWIKQVWIEGN
ncbi:SMI1/KNR4 family protein [Yersinia ruckeri]|uniref:SMI1/KNR4 family protein n=1 Tax=Yersinia ruckeri TaxID=29486 RepID=UPI000538C7B1|nr:SMI1/KNR4 family protein [Yersinia ruckeri]AUQ41959.1 SMI1/KNR4 family protein [Yersinia ruckeri]WMS06688.1 SMI1/KNR4 family protein [Yersinia ruckeri]